MPRGVDRASFLKAAAGAALTLPAAPALASTLRLREGYVVPPVYTKVTQIADLSTLAQLLPMVGLDQTLNGGGQGSWTLFAPTNEAFATMPAWQLNHLMNNQAKLTKLLQYHVLPEQVTLDQFQTGQYATLEGANVKITVVVPDKTVRVIKSEIVVPNVLATNGRIHIIDKVLTKILGFPN